MSVVDSISPMQEAWKESRLVLNDAVAAPMGEAASSLEGTILTIAGIAIFVLILLCSKRLAQGLMSSLNVLFTKKQKDDLFLDKYTYGSVIISYLICIPLLVFILSRLGVWKYNFLVMLAVMLGYNILKTLFFRCLAWLSSDKETIISVEKVYLCMVVISTVAMLLPFGLFLLITQMSSLFAGIICAGLFLICLIAFFIRSFQMIISSGFSLFFWFLYLCTLEILPICLVFKGFVVI